MQHNKHPATRIHDSLLNSNPPGELLAQEFITPTALFFVRNHAPVPVIEAKNYCLLVGGKVAQPLALSLGELKSRFAMQKITSTLQCAGNRRRELKAHKPIDDALEWDVEAIGTAEWGGVALREVLAAAGVDHSAAYVAFLGLDMVAHPDKTEAYGSSIPLEKALSEEVLLAYEMNGEALPAAHGGPLRVVVPGYIGARSVKWLSEITIQDAPSDNYFQQVAYKLFDADVSPDNVDYERGLMLARMNFNAVITHPSQGMHCPAGVLTLHGYAVNDGESPITRVEISVDDGATWEAADFVTESQPWAWRLWQKTLTLPAGMHTLVVRGWDETGKDQAQDIASVWNFKGYANNAWHRIQIRVGPAQAAE